jgi:hypothetical protein
MACPVKILSLIMMLMKSNKSLLKDLNPKSMEMKTRGRQSEKVHPRKIRKKGKNIKRTRRNINAIDVIKNFRIEGR